MSEKIMRTIKLVYFSLIGFNLLTLLCYITNPFYAGAQHNHWLTVIYISLCICMISLGFRSGVRNGEKKAYKGGYLMTNISKRQLVFYYLIYISTFLLKYAYELKVPAFDFSALLSRVVIGVSNPLIGYKLSLDGPQVYSWSLYFIICLLDTFFFAINFLNWKKLSKFMKFIFMILLLLEIFRWLAAGTTFGIVMLVTSTVLAYCCNIETDYISKRSLFRVGLIIFGMFIVAILAFRLNMLGRAGGDFSSHTMRQFSFNETSWIYKNVMGSLGEDTQNLFVYILFYLVGGYYNLEYAFSCDFDWCWFLGRNTALTNVTDNILGMDIESLNYQTKIFQEFGVDPYIQWHSCYLWLANDFTLWGVPLIVFVIAHFTGSALTLYRKKNDMLSGLVFIVFATMIILFFANNNFMSNVFFPYIFIFTYWLLTRYVRIR